MKAKAEELLEKTSGKSTETVENKRSPAYFFNNTVIVDKTFLRVKKKRSRKNR